MKIETSGNLREFLCNLLVKAGESDTDLNAIRVQVKVAEKITENLYAELKFQKLALEANKTFVNLGQLKLYDGK